MKVLVLNPQIDTLHQLAEGLRQEGAIVLEAVAAGDVLPILQVHGRTVDLAVIHREGESGRGDVGSQLIRDIRAQALQADLPLVLTSLNWGDAQFAQHQNSPQACHAYLKLPADPMALPRLIEKVLQASLAEERGRDEDALRSKRSNEDPTAARAGLSIDLGTPVLETVSAAPTAKGVSAGGPILEDASGLYMKSVGTDPQRSSSMTISLEAPLGFRGRSVNPEEGAPGVVASADAPISLAPSGLTELQVELSGLTPAEGDASGLPAGDISLNAGRSLDLSPAESFSETGVAPEAPTPELASPSPSTSPLLLSGMSSQELRNWVQPPIGDAIVPGGASQSPDLETLKRYLLLREQDVATLSAQLRSAKTQTQSLMDQLEVEKVRGLELAHENDRQKQTIRDAELERQSIREAADADIEEMRLQIRARNDKMRYLELQVKDAASEMDQLRERVRSDLRRIRVREQELENRLELLKRDSSAQLAAREEKLNEARRRADVLEFNNELLQSQVEREREVARKLRDQLAQVSRMVRMAGGVLEGESTASDGPAPVISGSGPGAVSQSSKSGRAA